MEKHLNDGWLIADNGFDGVNVAFPADLHSALLKANRIPNPYWASNEQAVRWVMERSWTVSLDFDLSGAEAEAAQFLELDRVNTLATVRLNAKPLGRCENVHRLYRFACRDLVKVGSNRLEIQFDNPVAAAKALAEAQAFPVPFLEGNIDLPHANLIRMVASDAGWDWNICLAPLGVNGHVKLVGGCRFSLDYVQVVQDHTEAPTSVSLEVTISGQAFADEAREHVLIEVDGKAVEASIEVLDHKSFQAQAHLQIDNPRLWWPAGMGSQETYDLKVTLDGEVVHKTLALRTVDLDLSPDDAGSSMVFAVNGQPLFAKGANWIPSDALPARRTPEQTRPLLQSAVDANMNMLRVWGGGQYEPDWLYDICTELGLLVWQDCMFSCHLYPSDDAFLDNVTAELEHNIRRMQHHGCLAMWCGDNELIGALTWYPESQANRDLYLVSYDRLNRTIEQSVKAYDPTRVFWPSSPCKGSLDFGDAWHEDGAGDMHYWNVWHEAAPFADFRKVKPRFCSEFGFQSFPSLPTVKTFAPKDEWNISSPAFERHQRNEGGNARIVETICRYFRFPKDFESLLTLSQLCQGLAFKTAVEYWRANTPHCAGALYWQLNDCWPVSSWATLEYGGRWKLAHYMAKKFFQPILISVIPEGKNFEVRLTSDLEDLDAISMELTWFDIRGRVLTKQTADAVRVPRMQSKSFGKFEAKEAAAIKLVAQSQGQDVSEQWHFPQAFKALRLEKPDLSMLLQDSKITLLSQTLTPMISLACDPHVRFSDNVFTMAAGDQRTVHVDGSEGWQNTLKVTSLRDTYD